MHWYITDNITVPTRRNRKKNHCVFELLWLQENWLVTGISVPFKHEEEKICTPESPKGVKVLEKADLRVNQVLSYPARKK